MKNLKIVIIILIIISIILFVFWDKDRIEFEKRIKSQNKTYQELIDKNYCINGTLYLFSEEFNKGTEVIVFKKCNE
jgi:hypothetical protein